MKEVNRRKFFQASGAAVACAALPLGSIAFGDRGMAKIDQLVDAAFVDVQDFNIEGMRVEHCKFTRCTFVGEVKLIKDCVFDHCGDVVMLPDGKVDNCKFVGDSGFYVVQAL